MPRTKGGKNKPKITTDFTSQIAEKQESIASLTAEITSITANIDTLKVDLKRRRLLSSLPRKNWRSWNPRKQPPIRRPPKWRRRTKQKTSWRSCWPAEWVQMRFSKNWNKWIAVWLSLGGQSHGFLHYGYIICNGNKTCEHKIHKQSISTRWSPPPKWEPRNQNAQKGLSYMTICKNRVWSQKETFKRFFC